MNTLKNIKHILKFFWKQFKWPFDCIMRFIDMKGIDCPDLPKRESKNPYELIWYKQGWSDKRTRRNNTKYWEWEYKNNKKI